MNPAISPQLHAPESSPLSPPVLAFYGDDFTGSADVMEVLQWFGMRTVLFLEPPTPAQLSEFTGLQAFGVAGTSRAMSVAEMNTELPQVFRQLSESGASIVHYKTCSTFDSSPHIGSIGAALELGRDVFGQRAVPVLIGAPNLGRYQVFGNLFARSGLDTDPFRLDRHPTMSRHPITPMSESDLRLVLAEQTTLEVELIDVLRLASSAPEHLSEAISRSAAGAVLLDVLTDLDLNRVGNILNRLIQCEQPTFLVGSSGVEYALTAAWSSAGAAERGAAERGAQDSKQLEFSGVDQLLVMTGSCSPVNDRQLAWADRHGFRSLAINTSRLVTAGTCQAEIEQVVERALELLDTGDSLVLHSSRGPDDPRVAETRQAMQRLGWNDLEIKLRSARQLGPRLGQILKRILAARPMPRVGVAGGDTSGFIARELGITALEAIAPVAPGSPLCRAHAPNRLNGVEFFFKGGQVGKDDVWQTMVEGTES
jgi:3-oxoisoapionate kinase